MEKNYLIDFRSVITEDLQEKCRTAHEHAPISTHQFVLEFYYSLGEAVCQIKRVLGPHDEHLLEFSRQLYDICPDIEEGWFSLVHLKRVLVFYQAYRDIKDDHTWIAIRKLSWHHHIKLLCRIKENDQRRFYLLTAAANNWTCETLCFKIKNNHYQIQGRMLSNFSITLPSMLAGLAQSVFMKKYFFGFVREPEGRTITEKELEEAIIANMEEFLKEMGPGFAFLRRQYRMNGGICDLILYHTRLKSHIIIEVKIGPFKPEYVGKLITYLHSADKELKGEGDNDTIGIILCGSANGGIEENPLEKCRCPIGVATYQIGG
ncbi:MAG TPA: PDDEXK nuclease domain-containing protein [Puia sp.]|nr:PDDEXK nuclease domain-containing protein [Puia sp.]